MRNTSRAAVACGHIAGNSDATSEPLVGRLFKSIVDMSSFSLQLTLSPANSEQLLPVPPPSAPHLHCREAITDVTEKPHYNCADSGFGKLLTTSMRMPLEFMYDLPCLIIITWIFVMALYRQSSTRDQWCCCWVLFLVSVQLQGGAAELVPEAAQTAPVAPLRHTSDALGSAMARDFDVTQTAVKAPGALASPSHDGELPDFGARRPGVLVPESNEGAPQFVNTLDLALDRRRLEYSYGPGRRDATLTLRRARNASATIPIGVQPPAEQLVAWQELYNATNGANWAKCSANYATPCNCSEPCPLGVPMVACNATSGSITTLCLEGFGLDGTVPPSVGTGLQSLGKALVLAQNPLLSGTIPTQLSLLSSVENLWLFSTQISGTLATQLGLLSSLLDFDVDTTRLSGTIMTQLGALSALSTLDVDTTSVSGTLATQLGLLSSLQNLYVFSTSISGTLATQLGTLSSLSYLDVYTTRLSGTIMTQLGALSSLSYLGLQSTNVSGTLATQLGALSALSTLDLGPTRLSGTIMTQLGALSALSTLALPTTRLSGTIMTQLGSLSSLSFLGLGDSPISGTLPPAISGLTKISTIDFDTMSLSGTLPPALFDDMKSLITLDLHNNPGLSGTLPTSLLSLPAIESVFLFNTTLSGAPLAQPINATALQTLQMQNAQLSGTIHDSFHAPLLHTLTLQKNAFSGTLPTSLMNLNNLNALIAIDNQISGTISSDIRNAGALKTLGLAKNRLSGTLPGSLGFAGSLLSVSLRLNALSGSLPAPLAYMPTLQDFDVAQNALTGPLPPFVANGTLRALRLGGNALSGRVSQNLLSMPLLEEVKLANNFLSCALPESSVDGSTLLPATPSSTVGNHVSILSGNRFGCPVPAKLIDSDVYGKRYRCGWSRLVGNGRASALTAPAGMVSLSFALVLLGALARRSAHAVSIEASGAPRGVQREVKAFLAFLNTTVGLAVVLTLISLILGSLYALGGSPIECRYEQRFTSAFLSSGVPPGLLEAIWVVVIILIVVWVYVQQVRRAVATKAAKVNVDRDFTLVVALGRVPSDLAEAPSASKAVDAVVTSEGSGAVPEQAAEQAAGGTLRPMGTALVACESTADRRAAAGEYTLLAFATSADASRWCTAFGKQCTAVPGAVPEDVDWANVLGVAAKPIIAAEATWLQVKLLTGVTLGLLLGLIPNAIFVLVESGFIQVPSGILTQLVTLAVSATKSLISMKIVPFLAIFLTNLMWLPSRAKQGATRVVLLVVLNFVNALFWPISTTLLLDPTCFRYALIPQAPVTLEYSLDYCPLPCFPGETCPNACGLKGCDTCSQVPESVVVQPPFLRDPSCPSTVLSIYSPIFLLTFAYGMLASASWLLLNYTRVGKALSAYANLRLEQLRARLLGPPKTNTTCKPPTLDLTNHYVQAAQTLAIVASFGIAYPLLAVVGTLKLCVDLYTMPHQLTALGATLGAKLRGEGVVGLPTQAVVSISAVSLGLLYFVWGPYGMLKLGGANTIVASAAITILPLVLFSRQISRIGVKYWRRARPADDALLQADGRDTMLIYFVASFEVWASDGSRQTIRPTEQTVEEAAAATEAMPRASEDGHA